MYSNTETPYIYNTRTIRKTQSLINLIYKLTFTNIEDLHIVRKKVEQNVVKLCISLIVMEIIITKVMVIGYLFH